MATKLIHGGLVFFNNQLVKTDILIVNDQIQMLGNNLPMADEIIDATGKLVTPGLVDVHVHLREPGQTYKETIATGSMAAAHGGFTTVIAMPNVEPVPDTPDKMAQQVQLNTEQGKVHVLQYGAITTGRSGNQLVNFSAMKQLGTVAFSNDGSGIQSAGTMYRAMQEIAQEHMILATHVEDESLLFGGVMAAGARADELGLPGIPSVAESAQLARDLILAQATGVHYHVCHVSTKESVELIRLAKARGIHVTCEVSPHHLLLTDQDILENDSYYKMNPPLRHEADRQALIEGLLDGTIDFIATDHAPHAKIEKPRHDMRGAANGITGLETAFPMLYTQFVKNGNWRLEQLLNWLSSQPAKVFGLSKAGKLEPGQPADVTIFDLTTPRKLNEAAYFSMGVNNPFTGQQVYGTADLTLVDGEVVYRR